MLNRKFAWFSGLTLALYLFTLLFFFEMPYGSTIFRDITKDHWARYDIEYMYNKGLMKGRDASVWNFYPAAEMTRAELVALELKANGVKTDELTSSAPGQYADIPPTHWFAPLLPEAEKRGLIPFQDLTQGLFQPDKPVTRGELAQAVVQALDIPVDTSGAQELADVAGAKYEDAIRTVVANKFAKGNVDGLFKPDENAKREQVASLFAQALQKMRPEADTKGDE